jgi:hypothetical protein
MGTWTAHAVLEARPEQVLDVLTDPDACVRWSPVEFTLENFADERLVRGSRARVTGRLAGREVGFDVVVLECDGDRFALRATGPVEIDAEYRTRSLRGRSELTAAVSVRSRGGLLGRLLAGATDGLLATGSLAEAVARIGREVRMREEALPLAA